jgi:hypothetical protein
LPQPPAIGTLVDRLYSDVVAEGRDTGWRYAPKWLRGIGNRVVRTAETHLLPDDGEARLELLEESLGDQIRIFGPDGGPTADARARVAKQLEAMGQMAEARLLRVEVLTTYRKHMGEDHPTTLIMEAWLVNNLYLSGMTESARMGAKRLYEARLRVSGPDDENTLWVKRMLVALGSLGDSDSDS